MMSSNLKYMTKVVIKNLHQTWLYRSIEDWCRKDALEIRENLGLERFSVTSSDPVEMYQTIKRNILAGIFHDDDTLQFLMDAPRWVGFSLDGEDFQSGQQIIGAARSEAISLLWLMAIPKLVISPKIMPEDYPVDEIKLFIRNLIISDESRSLLAGHMINAMESEGIPDIVFEPSPIGRGYKIDASMKETRLRSLLALIIMRSTGCPYDLDQVFTFDEEQIVEETTAFIVSMQAKTTLRNQISGIGVQRPFDWPLIGNPNICSRLFTTLSVLKQYSSRMTSCSMYSSESNGIRNPWNQREFVSFLLNEITDHYSEIHRVRHGKSKNMELHHFINLLTGENSKISNRIVEVDDPGTALFEELNEYKQKAKVGEKPQISPERRFRLVLSTLRQQVSDDKLEEISSDDIIDQVIEAFDAIVEVVESHQESLGDQSERFAQALCFETSYRILHLLDIGNAIMDVPWVSRFIAEESARSDISMGDMSNLDDEHRFRRIISAFAGGLTYLILQSSEQSI